MGITYHVSGESITKINDFFTEMYAFKHWFFKLKTYAILLENTEKFLETFGDKELNKETIGAYTLALKSEIVFTFYHMAESLFSLMYCAKNSEVPWLSMKELRFTDLCDYVRDEITTGKISDDDLMFLFYYGFLGEDAKKEDIVKSIKFIKEFLKRTGNYFLDNEIYSEYKHGLRVMSTNSSFQITPEQVPTPEPVLTRSGTTHVFLTTNILKKEGKDEIHQIQQKTVSFDWKLYLRLCIQIFRLMDNLFSIRRQNKKSKPGDKIIVEVFTMISIAELFKEDSANKFSLTIRYP